MKGFYTFSIATALFFIVAFALVSFDRDCKHIYTTVHQKEVKVHPVRWSSMSITPIILDTIVTGKKEGQELVCVKCFHLTKQILDYVPHEDWPRIIDSTGRKVKGMK